MKNKSLLVIITILALVAGFFVFKKLNRTDLTDEIELRISQNPEGKGLQVAELTVETSEEVLRFYEDRDFEEIWSSNGKINSQAEDFLNEIEAVKYDGLNPDDYNRQLIHEYFEEIEGKKRILRPKSAPELVDLEFLMTDAFFRLSKDLEVGKVGPEARGSYWKLDPKESKIDPAALLTEIGEGKKVEKVLSELYPDLEMYRKGRTVLQTLYEKSEEDTLTWKPVSFEHSLKVGDKDPSIPLLRDRLQFWGFLGKYSPEDELLFDSTMWEGLKKFQIENGMNPDGAIGELTADFLNDSPQKLIDIASVNMERMRWLPEIAWDQELVLVNIANFQLDYLNNRDTTLSAKVIVGKEYNESPVFTAPMSYIVFSPYWNVPPSITNSEILPSVKKNQNYLAEKNMEVVNNEGKVVSAKQVNWSGGDNFPYRIRQKPGGSNSLGLVKFMFPNDYNIYIHDTPARSLFERETRALSHGCIRIQYPDQFAEALLQDKDWTKDKIHQAMNQDQEQVVNLDREIPVVLLYLTFWADEKGEPHFRQDIYHRDEEVLNQLKKKV